MSYLKLTIISIIPIIELRGAIPVGLSINLHPLLVYLICVLSSTLVSVPLVLTFRLIL